MNRVWAGGEVVKVLRPLQGPGVVLSEPEIERALWVFDQALGVLVERFRESGEAVLLGARTFWQGLDIPGPDLQALVIEKLPFAVPTQLRKRREARLKAAGIDAFGRDTLGTMLLYLKQMVGRLIRSEEDRGLVVVVESRSDKRYFRRLGDALPEGVSFQLVPRSALPELLREVGIEGGD